VGLRYISSIAGKVKKILILTPSAWSYFNVVGEIWLADPAGSEGGAYFNSPSGTVSLFVDEPTSWGGAYFNREGPT